MMSGQRIPTITSFEAQGRGGMRIAIGLDGEPWGVLDAETVVRLNLRKGQQLDAAAQEQVLALDEAIRARKAAAGYNARRPRTRLELQRYLAGRKFSAAAAEKALAWLTESGTLDEENAARHHVKLRRGRNPLGPVRLRNELTGRGVKADHARKLVNQATEGVDMADEALAAARRLAGRYQPLEDPRQRAKLMAAVARRGYEGEHVRRAVERLCAEASVAMDEEEL